MIIAITGGTGFIGKRLVYKHLEKGDTVRVLTRQNKKICGLPDSVLLYHGDLTSNFKELIPFVNNADILYHLAGEINNTKNMYDVHINGTKNLINASRDKIGRWVQLSSVGVYGKNQTGTVNENTPINPFNIYEKTKSISDKLVISAGLKNIINFSMLRPSIVFGEAMTNQSLYQLISFIDKGLFFFIGKPGASANYIYIDNVIYGLIKCGKMFEAKGKIYNISDWKPMEEFVSIIAKGLGKKVPKIRIPEKPIRWLAYIGNIFSKLPLSVSRVDAFTNRCVYDTKRIENELNYKHPISMEQGLNRLIKFYKKI